MKKGFTLLELIIVVIVIGILVAIALPRFINVTERARLSEAYSILGAVRSSQLRYYAQYNNYASGAACTVLDVGNTTTKSFANPLCFAGAQGINVATMGRNPSSVYNIFVTDEGVYTCSGTGCPAL